MPNDLSVTKNNSLNRVRFVMKFVHGFDLSELVLLFFKDEQDLKYDKMSNVCQLFWGR